MHIELTGSYAVEIDADIEDVTIRTAPIADPAEQGGTQDLGNGNYRAMAGYQE